MTNSIGMRLRWIPAGSFRMGAADFDDAPVHEVIITEPFHMGLFPVTQKEYEAVVGNNPSTSMGATRPVESVT